jgi:hypothetical protein
MRAPTVVAISAAAHVALFAGLSQIALPALTVSAQPTGIAEPAREPIEVIVLSDPAPVVGHGVGPLSSLATSHAASASERTKGVGPHSSLATSHAASASESAATSVVQPREDGNGSGGEPGSDLMHMRARGTGLGITSEIAERIPGRPYVAPAEPNISGKLENTPGGGAVVHDTVTTMTVERDGHISFADKPDIDLHFHLPLPSLDVEELRQDLGRDLTTWFKDPYAATKFGSMSEVSRVWTAVPGACNSYGDVWCDDELAPQGEKDARDQEETGGSILGGNADISAYLHRKLIGDPYSSRKLKLLDDTRDERVARGTVFRTQQLVRSAELMQRTLVRLWAHESDPARRRTALFELWDDCDEGPGERGQAGQRARVMILGWIGAKLPRGSAGAFTDDELRQLDARRSSKQAFAPYPPAAPKAP